MQKYQNLFFERMKKTLRQWREKDSIEECTLYRFLHTVKGTAASIGLEDISNKAEEKLMQIDESEDRAWNKEEWEAFLEFLLVMDDIKDVQVKPKKENIEKLVENEKLILIIDDDIKMINYLKDNLEKEGYMALAALTGEKALKLFYDQKPDCILLDLHLPDKSGFELLDMMTEISQSYFIPILLLTSDDSKEARIKGYQKGAVDIIPKPFEFDELKARLENRIKLKEMISNAVLVDELTGAFNRKFLKLELSRYLFELARTKELLSLVIMDLDHFKNVNDTYGHLVGDIVLKGFSQFILKNKRQSDYLIRYGGEEFILLLPYTNKDDAKKLVDRLLQEFANESFLTEDGSSISVTFSAGIVQIDSPEVHLEEYVKRADDALYMAKEQGRNQVIIYEESRQISTTDKVIHIGIIDDDAVVHELVKDRLRKLTFGNIGMDVKSFREGESFFHSDWHKQNGKFLILLDGIMPKMDGLEVLRKLREEYSEKKFVVLMLTGRKSEKDIVRALELGADDYLTKPFNVGELEARVKRLVKRMM